MWQTHHLTVGLVRHEDTRPHPADIFGQRHDQFLAYGVDGRVGHLGKLLPEVVEEHLRAVGKHSQRRVVAHRGSRLLTFHCHGNNRGFDILGTISKHHLPTQQIGYGVFHMPSRLQLLQLNAVGVQPLAVRMFARQLLLYLAIIVDSSLLCVDEQNLSRHQPPLLCHLGRVEVHHAYLRCNHHHVVLCDGIASRTQTVPVEHAAGKPSVAEQQSGRTVPRFHQYRVVFVESL